MSDDISRKARLLSLAQDCERDAKRLADEDKDYDAERFRKLVEIYRDMAKEYA
jgi:hypothetical protein